MAQPKIAFYRRFIKGTNVGGEVPTIYSGDSQFMRITTNEFPLIQSTDIFDRELFANTVDNKLWIRFDDEIVQINGASTGSTSGPYVHLSGDTMSGTLYVPTISATTYQGLPTLPSVIITAFTYSNNVHTIGDSTGGTLSATINAMTGLTVTGTISATTVSGTTLYGDGSHLTGVAAGVTNNIKAAASLYLFYNY